MALCQNKKHPMWLCNTILSMGIQHAAVTYYSQVKPRHVTNHMQECNAYGHKLLLSSAKPSPGAHVIILTANVFPEPVWAIPTMSRPLMAIGQPWHWIAVGDSNPDFLQKCIHIHSHQHGKDQNRPDLLYLHQTWSIIAIWWQGICMSCKTLWQTTLTKDSESIYKTQHTLQEVW